jgi:hypothetical protein
VAPPKPFLCALVLDPRDHNPTARLGPRIPRWASPPVDTADTGPSEGAPLSERVRGIRRPGCRRSCQDSAPQVSYAAGAIPPLPVKPTPGFTRHQGDERRSRRICDRRRADGL